MEALVGVNVDVAASTAPATIVKVELELVSPVLLAVRVIEPAVVAVTDRLAMPPEAVALPSPVSTPVPEVLAKVTTVELSLVIRLLLASSMRAVSVREEPEVRLAVDELKLRWSAVAGSIVKVELELV